MTTITIITPVHNGESTIADTMRSVATQSHTCQHIVVDSDSNDGTVALVEGLLADVAHMFKEPEIDACYGDLVYVKRVDTQRVMRYWRAGVYQRKRFLNGWMPPHPTFFVRRRLCAEYGGYRSDLGTAADYEFMLRLLYRYQATAVYIPRVLVRMRMGGASNASLTNRLRANRADCKAWRVNGLRPRLWTLYTKPLGKLSQWIRKPDS